MTPKRAAEPARRACVGDYVVVAGCHRNYTPRLLRIDESTGEGVVSSFAHDLTSHRRYPMKDLTPRETAPRAVNTKRKRGDSKGKRR